MEIKKICVNSIPINIYNTNKFNTITLEFVFKNEYTRENVTKYSLLTALLTNSSKKYYNKQKVQDVLSDLYNCDLSIKTSNIYKKRVTTFTIKFIDSKFLDESIFNKCIDLLKEFILNPNIIDGYFDSNIFKEEVNEIKKEIYQSYEDNESICYNKFLEKLCPDEPVSIRSIGYLEDFDKITNKDIIDTYNELINNSKKSLYIIGNINNEMVSYLSSFVLNFKQNENNYPIYNINSFKKEPLIINDKIGKSQTIINIGYKTNIKIGDKLYYPFKMFCLILGEIFSSTLMTVIRNKLGFCYGINSSIIRDDILVISTDINKKNTYETIEEIKKIILDYQNGNIDSDLLENGKKYINNLDSTIYDNEKAYLSLQISHDLHNYHLSIDEINKIYNNITIDDIKEASKLISIDTIYILEGE